MSDFKAFYSTLKARAAAAFAASSPARNAVDAWPFWMPALVLATVVGHCV